MEVEVLRFPGGCCAVSCVALRVVQCSAVRFCRAMFARGHTFSGIRLCAVTETCPDLTGVWDRVGLAGWGVTGRDVT